MFQLTTDPEVAIDCLVAKGGYERDQVAQPIHDWLARGDDVLVFELHDLSAIGSGLPLYWTMPWERERETPPHAPDTVQTGLGWRYMPCIRVYVSEVTEWEVQGRYAQGWETVTTEATHAEAELRLAEYHANEPHIAHRIVGVTMPPTFPEHATNEGDQWCVDDDPTIHAINEQLRGEDGRS